VRLLGWRPGSSPSCPLVGSCLCRPFP
jgi:hypothetical protein